MPCFVSSVLPTLFCLLWQLWARDGIYQTMIGQVGFNIIIEDVHSYILPKFSCLYSNNTRTFMCVTKPNRYCSVFAKA